MQNNDVKSETNIGHMMGKAPGNVMTGKVSDRRDHEMMLYRVRHMEEFHQYN